MIGNDDFGHGQGRRGSLIQWNVKLPHLNALNRSSATAVNVIVKPYWQVSKQSIGTDWRSNQVDSRHGKFVIVQRLRIVPQQNARIFIVRGNVASNADIVGAIGAHRQRKIANRHISVARRVCLHRRIADRHIAVAGLVVVQCAVSDRHVVCADGVLQHGIVSQRGIVASGGVVICGTRANHRILRTGDVVVERLGSHGNVLTAGASTRPRSSLQRTVSNRNVHVAGGVVVERLVSQRHILVTAHVVLYGVVSDCHIGIPGLRGVGSQKIVQRIFADC